MIHTLPRLFFCYIAFIIFQCTGISGNTVSAQIHYGDNPAAGHYLNSRGIKLYYESYGKGAPLVLLHINGGSINVFSKQIPYFAKHYHVIAIDSRAHGKTIDTRDSLSFEMMADDVNALLDSLHLNRCYIIGWSDGGITGLVMAMRHPDKVKKLAVSGPNLWPDTTAIVPYVYENFLVRPADSLKRLPQTPDIRNQIKVTELDLKQPHITLHQLHSITCPTLVIGGDHDAIPAAHLVQIYSNITQAYLWIVPGTSHFVATSQKDQFNERIATFFAQPYKPIEGPAILQ